MSQLHPPTSIPVRVTLPANFIPCPRCGEHYIIDGLRIPIDIGCDERGRRWSW